KKLAPVAKPLMKAREERRPHDHWHAVALELDSDGLKCEYDGPDNHHQAPPHQLSDNVTAARQQVGDWRGLDPRYRATEAVGLFVNGGTAAFRRVWLERVADR